MYIFAGCILHELEKKRKEKEQKGASKPNVHI